MAWQDVIIGSSLYATMRPFAQPLIGTFHGWFATKMVVIMLFRPYKPIYWPFTQTAIPFTPGIFPSRQKAVALNIANTVTGTLITPADLQGKIKAWITKEHLHTAVGAVIDTVMLDLKNSERTHAMVRKFREMAPRLLDKANTSFIDGLTMDNSGQITRVTDWLVDEVLVPWHVSAELAESAIEVVFDRILTPETIRQSIVGALSPATNARLEAAIRAHSTGAVKFVATLMPIGSALNSCQNWLRDHPEEAREMVESALQDSDVRQHLTERVTGFSLSQLPLETVQSFRRGLADTMRRVVAEQREPIMGTLQRMEKHGIDAAAQAFLSWTPRQFDPELRETIQVEAATFMYRYLTEEMANLLPQLLAKLDLRTLIIDKIEGYSSERLEGLILGMIQRELRSLEVLGAVIGLFLGLIAWTIEFSFPLPR
ncbi:MAG: DUF445 family protein [Candidatus Sericytochromatia bacterium]|nr:DUF445 family protein [Candidatus Sericytochromatia bacterium]